MALTGRLVFVTGGGSGIGQAAGKILAREGASIVLADRKYAKIEETLQDIKNNFPNSDHLGLELNVENLESVKGALKKVLEKYSKPPTIIVNSAGIARANFLLKTSEGDFDEVVDVNLKGTFLVTQVFANSIVQNGLKGASIINLASIAAKYGAVGQVGYSASKAGVVALTRTACKEFGQFGIRINAVLPGLTRTPMIQPLPENILKKMVKDIPLGRIGEPEEIGEVIAFLASDQSSYVNGAAIDVAGG